MTGQTVAVVHWRALDREGDDKCRLARADHGWLLVGHARFRDADGFAALDYVVRCDARWHTLGADVTGLHDGRDVRLQAQCENGTWRLNGDPQQAVGEAADIDLSFTPATNLMPLRRLAVQQDDALEIRAAWLDYPDTRLKPLDQIYRRTGVCGHVVYEARQTVFTTELETDESGFVTLYPELWQGQVINATS